MCILFSFALSPFLLTYCILFFVRWSVNYIVFGVRKIALPSAITIVCIFDHWHISFTLFPHFCFIKCKASRIADCTKSMSKFHLISDKYSIRILQLSQWIETEWTWWIFRVIFNKQKKSCEEGKMALNGAKYNGLIFPMRISILWVEKRDLFLKLCLKKIIFHLNFVNCVYECGLWLLQFFSSEKTKWKINVFRYWNVEMWKWISGCIKVACGICFVSLMW